MAAPVIFGEMPDGTPVHAVEVASDQLRATILTHGARLHRLSRGDGPNAVVAQDLGGYLGAGRFNGPVVGPVANRIAGAKVEVQGQTYGLEPNEGQNSLHSGSHGCHDMVWQIEVQTDQEVTLLSALPDGQSGLPGHREIRATYRAEDDDLVLTLAATTDAPTLMNLAHHAYWTLGGGETLEVFTDRYLPVDAEKIPTGEVATVAGTPFDHRIPKRPDPSLDHNFCFDPASEPRTMVRLTAQDRSLEIASDAPGLQVYAGGAAGIAIEPQFWPDAPHHPHFPSIQLNPGETFRQTTHFLLGVSEAAPSV